MKANRIQQATKELNNIDDGLAQRVNTEIKETDRGYYHVAMINIKPIKGSVRNKVIVNVQMFNNRVFEKFSKKYKSVCDHAIVLHNAETTTKQEVKEPVSDVNIEDEIQRRVKEQIELMKKEQEVKEPVKLIQIDDSGLDNLTIVELKQYASDNGIDLSGQRNKEDIHTTISMWIEDKNNESN